MGSVSGKLADIGPSEDATDMTSKTDWPSSAQADEIAAGLHRVMLSIIDGETQLSDVVAAGAALPGTAAGTNVEVLRDALHTLRLVTRTLSGEKTDWLKYAALAKELPL